MHAIQSSRKLNILVVDDEPLVRKSITLLLKLNGHAVTVAETGSQALAMSEAAGQDLVILDYEMPDMKGDELATLLKRKFPGLPILMVTAYGEEVRSRVTAPAFDAILCKPFGATALLEAIHRLCHGAEVALDAGSVMGRS